MSSQKVHSPQSVTRVIRILEVLCGSAEPISLAEISRRLDSPKSSIVSLLRGLEEAGFVQAADNGWRLGAGAFGLGSALVAARGRLQSSELIRAGMAALAQASGETVIFAVANEDGTSITYVDVVESRETVRYAVSLGERRELYCTASGRMILAARPKSEVEAYLKGLKPAALTATTLTGKKELTSAIADARASGVAQTIDQAANGATDTAALVRDAAGHVLGALVVAAPTARAVNRLDELQRLVRDSAADVSRTLGYRA